MTVSFIDMKWVPRTSGVMPEEARRYYIRFLQDFFKNGPGPDFVWDPDPLRTKVYIGGPDMNVEETNPRPVIVVNFAGGKWMGHFKDQYVQDIYVDDPKTESRYLGDDGKPILGHLYSDVFRGSISCSCRARELNAMLLANKVFMALTVFKEVLRHTGIFDISTAQISREQVVKGDVKEITTEVRVDTEFQTNVSWVLTPFWHDGLDSTNSGGGGTTVDVIPPVGPPIVTDCP